METPLVLALIAAGAIVFYLLVQRSRLISKDELPGQSAFDASKANPAPSARQPEPAVDAPLPEITIAEDRDGWPLPALGAAVKRGAASYVDARELPSVRLRVRGQFAAASDRRRMSYGNGVYALVREPNHPHDANAIAVHGIALRRVGYVSAARAAMTAPLIDELGGKLLVTGDVTQRGSNTPQMHVNVPTVAALRNLLQQLS